MSPHTTPDLACPKQANAVPAALVATLLNQQRVHGESAVNPGQASAHSSDQAQRRIALAQFADHYVHGYRQCTLTAPNQMVLEHAFAELLAHRATLHLPENAGNFAAASQDLVRHANNLCLTLDEADVLDHLVRFWQAARGVGLHLNTDFGEFYRALQVQQLQECLAHLGGLALQCAHGDTRGMEEAPAWMQLAHGIAGRYREYRPLQRLLEQVEGIKPVIGFAYGRV